MLDLFNEPFLPTGSIDARATRTALGVTDMEVWDVFLRETVQNSWDAKGSARRIDYRVDAFRPTEQQLDVLAHEIFGLVPPTLIGFKTALGSSPPEILAVSDRGTLGLGGPIRADRTAMAKERTDFRDFVRNVGRDESKHLGGGTYGFGKGVFYNASSIRTCVIYTQARVGDRIEERLIVTRVDRQYGHESLDYTGRHWWGTRAEDGVLDPVVGPAARELCEALGLLRLDPSDTGTTVAVIAPIVPIEGDNEALRPIVHRLSDAALKWCWPHMVVRSGGPSINFNFQAYGEHVQVANPETHPVVKHYVSAFRKAESNLTNKGSDEAWPTSTKPIQYTKGSRYLGQLGYTKWLTIDDQIDGDWSDQHHIALMRAPRLVVKYLPVQPDPAGQQIAGVFIAALDENEEFAAAEPVAHDDWKPPVVPVREGHRSASPVRFALARIVDEFRSAGNAMSAAAGADQSPAMARVSRMLGDILSGLTGGGEVVAQAPSTPGRRTAVGPKVSILPSARLGTDEAGLFSDFSFVVTGIAAGSGLAAEPLVVLDRGVERPEDRPRGAPVPEVIGWYLDSELQVAGPFIKAQQLINGPTSVRIRQPSSSAISVNIRIVEAVDRANY
jgi:hypothetical protein